MSEVVTALHRFDLPVAQGLAAQRGARVFLADPALHGRALAAGVAMGALHLAAGLWACGADWPMRMMAFLTDSRAAELAANGPDHFSLVRVATLALPEVAAVLVMAFGLGVPLLALLRTLEAGRSGSTAWWALALCLVLLASPHLQYYEAALLVLPAALLVEAAEAQGPGVAPWGRLLLAVGWLSFPAWSLGRTLGFQPLLLPLLALTVWALWALRAEAARNLRAGAQKRKGRLPRPAR